MTLTLPLGLPVLTLTFLMLILLQQAQGQCSGTTHLFTATGTFQVFTSLNYPFNYNNNLNCVWRIEAGNATDAIRLEVTDTGIEYHADCVYDFGDVFDGYNVTSTSLGKFCGTSTPTYVSTANYLTVVFVSDYSLSSRGFKAQYKSGERSTLLDPEDESTDVSAIVILGASMGAVVLIIIIMAITFTYIQAKKAKEIRRNPHLRRSVGGMNSSRVEPFSYDYGPQEFCGPPPPPPYGDIYSTPVSPPPGYAEVDPNPQHELQLPGRPTDAVPGVSDMPTSGAACNISVIPTNPANMRFVRSPQPPTNHNVPSLQTTSVLQTSSGTAVGRQQSIQRNSSITTGRVPASNRMTTSNAGSAAAMQLLGGAPQDSTRTPLQPPPNRLPTRPNQRPDGSLPTAGAPPSASNTAQPSARSTVSGTTTAVVTNAPRARINRVASHRSVAPAPTENGRENNTNAQTGIGRGINARAPVVSGRATNTNVQVGRGRGRGTTPRPPTESGRPGNAPAPAVGVPSITAPTSIPVQAAMPGGAGLQRTPSDVSAMSIGRSMTASSLSSRSVSLSSLSSQDSSTPTTTG